MSQILGHPNTAGYRFYLIKYWLSHIYYWVVTPPVLCDLCPSISCGQNIVDLRICGWVSVYMSLLVACRVGLKAQGRHQLDLSMFKSRCSLQHGDLDNSKRATNCLSQAWPTIQLHITQSYLWKPNLMTSSDHLEFCLLHYLMISFRSLPCMYIF